MVVSKTWVITMVAFMYQGRKDGGPSVYLFFFVSELWIILFFFLVYLFLTCLCIGYFLGLVLDVSRIKI